MRNNNIIKIILISFVILIILSIAGYSYAYFSLEVEGEPKDITMSTGDLRLIYKDDTELKLVDALPGDSISKVITVNNAGTKSATYSLYWGNLINTINDYELHVTLECKSYINYGESNQTESGTCDKIYRAVPISSTVTTGTIKNGISIEPGITQEYKVAVKFDNKPYSQNDNLGKTFTGKIGIEEYIEPIINCTYDGELTTGAIYVNGQYTYMYKYQYTYYGWEHMEQDGWGVMLTDLESTDPVTSKVCTYINDKPVVSMSGMFFGSQSTSIDFSSFNTKNVVNMSYMFYSSAATTLDLSSFDTSNVIDMNNMFASSSVTNLDLSSFDTSKVTDMEAMFYNRLGKITAVDVSSFDTSKVTNMYYMFYQYKNKKGLDISNFDTSNVTGMGNMFSSSQVEILDLSNFDTSKVTDMSWMFSGCSNLKTIYVNDKFVTNNVTTSKSMFLSSTKLVGGAGTVYDANYVDKTYARVDGGTLLPGYFTLKTN